MFLSITFPVADFRSLLESNGGRLERPSWGRHDPQAAFARGFGAIHTRNKSSSGFIGENYYADCESLIKYPKQLFVDVTRGSYKPIVVYPIYRRFYFDGNFSGRFELGFRLNEAAIHSLELLPNPPKYDVASLSKGALSQEVRLSLLDGRVIQSPLNKISDYLRDAYILSSTKREMVGRYDLPSIAGVYVSVGRPFVFVRSVSSTPTYRPNRARSVISDDAFRMYIASSGVSGSEFDTAIVESNSDFKEEYARERIARLFYTQLRALIFSYSFYMKSVDDGSITAGAELSPSIRDLVERLKSLRPLEDSEYDAEVCRHMTQILSGLDVAPERLAEEIESRLKPNKFRRWLGRAFGYFDRKVDVGIEAAASAATERLLSGGP